MKQNLINIDIVSDIVCPWCWVGKQSLDTALAQAGIENATINWRPFMLDAGIPENGVPYKKYLEKKFGKGGSDRFKPMRKALVERADDLGIEFKFDDIPMRPNTLKAHILMKVAHEEGKAHTLSEALFKAFFYDLKDIGDEEVLKTIAKDIGLTAKNFNYESNQQAVEKELEYFRKLGVTSVPTFIYNGTFAISGGQPAEAHLEALNKAASIASKNILTVMDT